MTTKSMVTTRNGNNPPVDWVIDWCYNTYIATKEHKMTDTQIVVTVVVVAVVFAVKVWILTKI